MARFVKTDLFRNFLGGFALGAIALFAFQPQQSRAEIGDQLAAPFVVVDSTVAR